MSSFTFKHFTIKQSNSALKVGTDAMVLGAHIEVENFNSALDIGAETGVLSLMIAQKNPKLKITSIEIDSESCIDLRSNIIDSNWKDNISVIEADFTTHEFVNTFDLIFSNPPFYENSLQNSDKRIAKAKHEANLSFDILFEKVANLLTEKGKFWIIQPIENASKWIEKAEMYKLYCCSEIIIYGKPEISKRIILVFSKIRELKSTKEFLIRNSDNSYSEQYKQLTREYHSKSL